MLFEKKYLYLSKELIKTIKKSTMETFTNDLHNYQNSLDDNGLCFRCEENEVENPASDNCQECIAEIEYLNN